jgi:hypothetical protein
METRYETLSETRLPALAAALAEVAGGGERGIERGVAQQKQTELLEKALAAADDKVSDIMSEPLVSE